MQFGGTWVMPTRSALRASSDLHKFPCAGYGIIDHGFMNHNDILASIIVSFLTGFRQVPVPVQVRVRPF